ncbi:hypothetical protein [Streptomyces coeruleorubidus]|uniref:hypothetical protein n=1 Tax=Streptomyces coeruleorubidus TaxID=116188 RepID=UPI0036A5CA66
MINADGEVSASGRGMPDGKFLVGVGVGVVSGADAVLVLGGLGTRLVSGPELTTELNQFDTVVLDDRKAFAPNIVASRTQSSTTRCHGSASRCACAARPASKHSPVRPSPATARGMTAPPSAFQ